MKPQAVAFYRHHHHEMLKVNRRGTAIEQPGINTFGALVVVAADSRLFLRAHIWSVLLQRKLLKETGEVVFRKCVVLFVSRTFADV